MASPDRTATRALIEQLRRAPYRFDFTAALRLIECHYAERPRLGESLKATDDPVRLGQPPDLDFAPADLAYWRERDEGLPYYGNQGEIARRENPALQARLAALPPRLGVRCLGLFGPNGPLPLHLTEYARDRQRERDLTFARFADVFHHRMLCLFYRAWANTQPVVSLDRPESDPFGTYLAAYFGLSTPALRHRDALPDPVKLHFAGLMAGQTRHPGGLRAMLETFLGIPAAVLEFIGEWMTIPEPDRTRLGETPRTGSLGHSAVLGARVWGCQHKFRLRLGPMRLSQYLDFLPGRRGLAALTALTRNYAGDERVWDCQLVLQAAEIPTLRLNASGQLGWTTWLGERRRDNDADDLRLDPEAPVLRRDDRDEWPGDFDGRQPTYTQHS